MSIGSKREAIRTKAVEIIEGQPTGIRYSQLVKQIHEALPEIPLNTIHGNVWNLEVKVPDRVVKPARGVYLAPKYVEVSAAEPTAPTATQAAQEEIQEEQFYESFAEWLMTELEECTKAIALGGNRFKDKWGTPDVIGIRAPRPSDIIKPPTEIVSAELKIDRAGLIVAFGQACAYKLFSHRSYIVVPSESQEEDIARLDVLCRTLGVGLILFDAENQMPQTFKFAFVRTVTSRTCSTSINTCASLRTNCSANLLQLRAHLTHRRRRGEKHQALFRRHPVDDLL